MTTKNVKNVILENKDKIKKCNKSSIYQISVPDNNNNNNKELVYIGNSKRPVIRRMLEHNSNIAHSRPSTALA